MQMLLCTSRNKPSPRRSARGDCMRNTGERNRPWHAKKRQKPVKSSRKRRQQQQESGSISGNIPGNNSSKRTKKNASTHESEQGGGRTFRGNIKCGASWITRTKHTTVPTSTTTTQAIALRAASPGSMPRRGQHPAALIGLQERAHAAVLSSLVLCKDFNRSETRTSEHNTNEKINQPLLGAPAEKTHNIWPRLNFLFWFRPLRGGYLHTGYTPTYVCRRDSSLYSRLCCSIFFLRGPLTSCALYTHLMPWPYLLLRSFDAEVKSFHQEFAYR